MWGIPRITPELVGISCRSWSMACSRHQCRTCRSVFFQVVSGGGGRVTSVTGVFCLHHRESRKNTIPKFALFLPYISARWWFPTNGWLNHSGGLNYFVISSVFLTFRDHQKWLHRLTQHKLHQAPRRENDDTAFPWTFVGPASKIQPRRALGRSNVTHRRSTKKASSHREFSSFFSIIQ